MSKIEQNVIGVDEVVADLKAIIEEFGEGIVYGKDVDKEFYDKADTCRYRDHANEPQCIVGQWLARRGVNLGIIDESQNRHSFRKIYPIPPAGGVALDLTDDAVRMLDAVQNYQDLRIPWGESLRRALADPEEGE